VTVKRDTVRAIVWLSLTGLLIVSSFATSLSDKKPDKTTFFDWSVPAGVLAEFVLLAGVALALTRGEHRELLALRKPVRLGRTALLALGTLVGTGVLSEVMSVFGDPDKEQGIAPTHWIHGHTLEFVASILAVSILVPIAEEAFFRGAGLGLLARVYSVPGAIVLSGCLFALIHGLVLGFLPLAFFGTMLALMRVTSGSLLPGILLHGAYNALAIWASLDFRLH
jgi:membrane protease YdiL (CAAX protease family)